MKSLSKIVLVAYVLILLWLVLFKLSFDIISILETHQARSLNLIPFAGHLHEMIDNFIVFVPFGLLLNINFKQITFWQKLILISASSLVIEIMQFILAIGISDMTDIMTNTLGGLFGLICYDLLQKHVDPEKMSRFITIAIMILIVLFIALRLFVFRVRY